MKTPEELWAEWWCVFNADDKNDGMLLDKESLRVGILEGIAIGRRQLAEEIEEDRKRLLEGFAYRKPEDVHGHQE